MVWTTRELRHKILLYDANQDMPVFVFVGEDVVADDSNYWWGGKIKKITVEKTCLWDCEGRWRKTRIWECDKEDLRDEWASWLYTYDARFEVYEAAINYATVGLANLPWEEAVVIWVEGNVDE